MERRAFLSLTGAAMTASAHQLARRHLHAAIINGDNESREGALRYALLATSYIREPDPDLDHAIGFAERATDLLAKEWRGPGTEGRSGVVRCTVDPPAEPDAVAIYTSKAAPYAE